MTRRRIGGFIVPMLLAVACPGALRSMETDTMTQFATSPDGVRIAYDRSGAGDTALLFIHGWSCDRTYWDSQTEAFPDRYRVIAVDIGGHGESGAKRDEWTIESLGADVAAVANAEGLARVVLIGHSMGGDVAIDAARRLGNRVAGVVWVDTYRTLEIHRTEAEIEAAVAPFKSDFKATTDSFVRDMFPPGAETELVDRVATDMAAAPPKIAVPLLASTRKYGARIAERVQEIDAPVFAINAEHPPTDFASMQRNGVEVMTAQGVGHFLMMEDPPQFNALLLQALDTLSE